MHVTTQEIIHQGNIVVQLCMTMAMTNFPVENILPGGVVTQHATYVHAQQGMEKTVKKNIAVETEYVMRLVTAGPAIMPDAIVTQGIKETSARNKVYVTMSDCKKNDFARFLIQKILMASIL